MNKNPCSNHDIHMLFEHWFLTRKYLKRTEFVCMAYTCDFRKLKLHAADAILFREIQCKKTDTLMF